MFVNLHVHTHKSLFDATAKEEDIAKRVAELGEIGFGISDHGTTSALVTGYKEAKKKGLKFVFGAEFYIVNDMTIKDSRKNWHLCIYAKNNIGYKNMLKLMTIAHKDGFYYKPRIDFDLLRKYSEGLIVTSACIGGILNIQNTVVKDDVEIKVWDSEAAKERAILMKEIIGEHFFIEVHTYQDPEQFEYNQKISDLARELGIPLLAACDSHYVYKHEADTHRKWKGIGEDDESGYYQTDDFFLHSEEEVREKLAYLPGDVVDEAIKNTVTITELCNVTLPFGEKHYPIFPVDDHVAYIRKICEDNWCEKVTARGKDEEACRKRYEYEMSILERVDYINYLLITWDILIRFCDINNIYRDVGRGSVAGCYVAFLMGITKLDPLDYGLLFERFCNPDRVSPGDIDSDVMKERRGEVIEYIRQTYGKEGGVYQVRTFGYMGAKGALKRAGQAYKVPPTEVNELSKKVNPHDDKYEAQIAALDRLIDEVNFSKPEYVPMIELAKKFIWVIQNNGVHASAVIVFPCDPTEGFCAIERQGDNYVAAYEFTDLEEMGLLKQDILGLKTCDVIYNTVQATNGEVTIEQVDNLPETDDKTFDLICTGGTSGVFQVEGQGMTDLIKKIQPRNYRDLIPLVALYRPGCLDAGMVDVYVDRRNGVETVEYLHPKLEAILKETYGVILYQEQIQKISQELCGYSLGEGDVLRRVIGKKKPEDMAVIIPQFIERGIKNGISESVIKTISDQIITFAGYGFNQSHSAAYGFIAYQTAWLKAHYPLQFMCALLNSEGGNVEKTVPYINECRRMGIKVLPPDINKSKVKWSIEGNSIRVGLSYIKYVGEFERKGYAINFLDFVQGHKLNKRYMEALIKAGVFTGEDRGLLLAQYAWRSEYLADIKKWAKKVAEAHKEGKALKELISCYPAKIVNEKGRLVKNKEYDKAVKQYESARKKYKENKTKIKEVPPFYAVKPVEGYNDIDGEMEVLGFSFKDILNNYNLSLAVEPHETKKEIIIGGEVTRFHKIKDKNKKDMAFISIRTATKPVELVMFWRQFVDLKVGEVYLFSAKECRIVNDVREAERIA